MTTEEQDRAARIVDRAFDVLAGAPAQGSRMLALTTRLTDGKLYELRVLAWLLPRLLQDGFTARLENGPNLVLRYNPGQVDRSFPYFTIRDQSDEVVAEIWGNVEFVGLGFPRAQPARAWPLEPDYHELDIAVTIPGIPDGRVSCAHVLIAVECKDRYLEKRMLREMLGLRRELSLMAPTQSGDVQLPINGFPSITTQHPPIRLFLCTSSALPRNYSQISSVHGVHVLNVKI